MFTNIALRTICVGTANCGSVYSSVADGGKKLGLVGRALLHAVAYRWTTIFFYDFSVNSSPHEQCAQCLLITLSIYTDGWMYIHIHVHMIFPKRQGSKIKIQTGELFYSIALLSNVAGVCWEA